MKTSGIKEQFKNECQVFELKYEYPGYAGYERPCKRNLAGSFCMRS